MDNLIPSDRHSLRRMSTAASSSGNGNRLKLMLFHEFLMLKLRLTGDNLSTTFPLTGGSCMTRKQTIETQYVLSHMFLLVIWCLLLEECTLMDAMAFIFTVRTEDPDFSRSGSEDFGFPWR